MDGRYGMATGSYVEQRDDWLSATERAAREDWPFLELTAVLESLLESLPAFLTENQPLLERFERLSLHAPIHTDSRATTIEAILSLPLDGAVILHPDAWGTEAAVRTLGSRAVFENMDVAKPSGQSVEDLTAVFSAHPVAGFCLNVAHVWTNDHSLQLGHDLIDAFGDRLRQLHVSGIEPDGAHRPTTEADLELYRPLLERCTGVPWILEAVIV
jgi:hypothetical protein